MGRGSYQSIGIVPLGLPPHLHCTPQECKCGCNSKGQCSFQSTWTLPFGIAPLTYIAHHKNANVGAIPKGKVPLNQHEPCPLELLPQLHCTPLKCKWWGNFKGQGSCRSIGIVPLEVGPSLALHYHLAPTFSHPHVSLIFPILLPLSSPTPQTLQVIPHVWHGPRVCPHFFCNWFCIFFFLPFFLSCCSVWWMHLLLFIYK